MIRPVQVAGLLLLIAQPLFSASPRQVRQIKDTGSPAVQIPPEKQKPIEIPKLSESSVIDGKLEDEAWKHAAVFKDFYQTGPGYNIAPSKPTEAYAFYDDEAIYFAFKCWDEPDKIRSTIAARDAIFEEDYVRIWLDTYDDRRRAYELSFNPLGIQQDGILVEGQATDYSVDVVMESKGAIQDWGWAVEVRIPFRSLRYRAGPGRNWGINFARVIQRFNHEIDGWMPDDRNIAGLLIKHGRITGLNEIRLSQTLSVIASTTLSETGKRSRTIPLFLLTPSSIDPGHFTNLPVHGEVGATIKYAITPNLTFDVAINPDFAEIEADAPVVTINRRFPIFYEEKRPFFLEGIDILNAPNRLFHSRTIVEPDLAAKLAGKIGRTSMAVLFAIDAAPGKFTDEELNDPFVRPSIEEFIGKKALVGVLRVKRDIGESSSIGIFESIRSFPERHNNVFGFDGRFKLSPNFTASLSSVGTTTRTCFFDPFFDPVKEPDRGHRNRDICGTGTTNPSDPPEVLSGSLSSNIAYRTGLGFGYSALLEYSARNRGWSVGANGQSRDYVTDVGFTERTNRNGFFLSNRRNTEPKPQAPLISFNWTQNVDIYYDWDGRIQDFNGFTDLEFTLQHNTSVILQPAVFYEKIREEEFGLSRLPDRAGAFVGDPERDSWQGQFVAVITSAPVKRFNFEFSTKWVTNSFDYDLSHYPLNPGPGLEFDVNARLGFRPVDALNLSLDYSKYKLTRYDTNRVAFDANIVSLRSTYQFTRFTFTRFRLDYDSIARRVAGQVLFGWTPNPGTAIYAGYNDDLNYNGFSPYTGQYEPRFQRNGRTLFLRLSYLFQRRL